MLMGLFQYGVGRTVDGACATYSQQLELPLLMNDLTNLAAEVFSDLGADSARVYGYAAAFPYFETWQPARDDLWSVAIVTLVASGILSVLVLEPWTAASTILGIASGASATLVFMVNVLDGDLNLVTAVNVFLAPTVLCTCLFYIAYRFSGFVAFLGSAREARHVFRKFMWNLLAPGVGGPFFGLGAAGTVFLFSKSPVNLTFVYLYEWTLVCAFAVGLLLMPPVMFMAVLGTTSFEEGDDADTNDSHALNDSPTKRRQANTHIIA